MEERRNETREKEGQGGELAAVTLRPRVTLSSSLLSPLTVPNPEERRVILTDVSRFEHTELALLVSRPTIVLPKRKKKKNATAT